MIDAENWLCFLSGMPKPNVCSSQCRKMSAMSAGGSYSVMGRLLPVTEVVECY